jgi:hypothetical protein
MAVGGSSEEQALSSLVVEIDRGRPIFWHANDTVCHEQLA